MASVLAVFVPGVAGFDATFAVCAAGFAVRGSALAAFAAGAAVFDGVLAVVASGLATLASFGTAAGSGTGCGSGIARATGTGVGAAIRSPPASALLPSTTGAGVEVDHCNPEEAGVVGSGVGVSDAAARSGAGAASVGVRSNTAVGASALPDAPAPDGVVAATVSPHACTSGLFSTAVLGTGSDFGERVGIALATRCRLAVQFERSDSSDCVSASR
ncbi:MAG: hypothetical protein JZU52_02120 [Lamprocystis purpurea]|nr:hypothetical protein [Lamprocystis purpurea]